MAPHSSTLACKIPWMQEPGGLESMGSLRVGHDFTFTFHFHALEKEMATHSSVLAWRIPGTGEPGGLPSMGSHRVGHDWSDLAHTQAHTHKLELKSEPSLANPMFHWCANPRFHSSPLIFDRVKMNLLQPTKPSGNALKRETYFSLPQWVWGWVIQFHCII